MRCMPTCGVDTAQGVHTVHTHYQHADTVKALWEQLSLANGRRQVSSRCCNTGLKSTIVTQMKHWIHLSWRTSKWNNMCYTINNTRLPADWLRATCGSSHFFNSMDHWWSTFYRSHHYIGTLQLSILSSKFTCPALFTQHLWLQTIWVLAFFLYFKNWPFRKCFGEFKTLQERSTQFPSPPFLCLIIWWPFSYHKNKLTIMINDQK